MRASPWARALTSDHFIEQALNVFMRNDVAALDRVNADLDERVQLCGRLKSEPNMRRSNVLISSFVQEAADRCLDQLLSRATQPGSNAIQIRNLLRV